MSIFFSAFQGGFFTFLNPIVFPFLIHNLFLFEKMESRNKGYRLNVFLFTGITLLLITFFLENLVSEDIIQKLNSNKRLNHLLNLPYLLFIIWVLIINLSKLDLLKSIYFRQTFRAIGLFSSICRLFIGSLSGFGPILGLLMLNKTTSKISTFGFSLGLLIPFLIFLLLISKKYDSWKSKKWWKIAQTLICCYLIINLVLKIFE